MDQSLGVYLWDPQTGAHEQVFHDAEFDNVQPRAVRTGGIPDGRSTVVNEENACGKLYCLNANVHNLPQRDWWSQGLVRRVRVLEGVARSVADADQFLPPLDDLPGQMPGSSSGGLPPLAERRLLGEVSVNADGSFHLTIPANTPIQVQALDEDGMALRSCGWIWSKNNENRGCIGCHEDGELTPENFFAEALGQSAIDLTLPPERRRTMDFRRDIMPIVEQKCVGCHDAEGAEPRLDGGLQPIEQEHQAGHFNRAYRSLLALDPKAGNGEYAGMYVQPGRARASRLIWHLYGRNTARPWDGELTRQEAKPIPPHAEFGLSDQERRAFVEWVDWGAPWGVVAGDDPRSGMQAETEEAR
jgi:hypothetical protein